MRSRMLVAVAVLVALQIGCGSGSTSGGGNKGFAVGSPTFVYALNGAAGVTGYKVNNDGSLASIGTFSANDTQGLAYNASFIYAINGQSTGIGNIDAYSFNAQTGALSTVSGSPFAGTAEQTALAACPGKFLFALGTGNVKAYTVGSNGALTPASALQVVNELTPLMAVVDSACKFLFVANGGAHTISVLSLSATGTATPVAGSPFSAGGIASSIALAGGDKFLYSADAGNNQVLGFAVNSTTGALTPVPGSPFNAGTAPISLAVSGNFLYVANNHSNDVTAYAIDATTGRLTAVGAPFAAGSAPIFVLGGLSTHDTSALPLVYVANSASGNISAYTAASGGALSPITGSPYSAAAGTTWLLSATGPQ